RGGAVLHGVDISQVAVEEANRRGLKAQCCSLDTALPFANESFDAVICLEVLEHLMMPEFTCREIHRVLRPGGQVLISVPNVAAWRNRMELLLLGHFNPGGSPQTARRYPWPDPHIRSFNY